jgi:tetraacyldisaccharide 4'-kinase
MANSLKQFGLRAISGEDRTLAGKMARVAASAVEPVYSAAMRLRNVFYDRGIFRGHDLGRPTISVGNITTGGTGKTPVVCWLAEQLRSRGRRPAILLRGYGASDGHGSDEARLLDCALNGLDRSRIPVEANPSRVAGAADVLAARSDVDVFVLDDAFQHRRARRDFNLVLISATLPFGYGQVLPRGLLREPLSGLGRADAFLITRCGLVKADALAEIDRLLKDRHPQIPVYHCDHEHAGLWLPMENRGLPMDAIAGEKIFITAAIGDPESFRRQIESLGCSVVGARWFADHHAFSPNDVDALAAAAKGAGADRLVTTEKDWVKLSPLMTDRARAIAVVQLRVGFRERDGERLLAQVERMITWPRPMVN